MVQLGYRFAVTSIASRAAHVWAAQLRGWGVARGCSACMDPRRCDGRQTFRRSRLGTILLGPEKSGSPGTYPARSGCIASICDYLPCCKEHFRTDRGGQPASYTTRGSKLSRTTVKQRKVGTMGFVYLSPTQRNDVFDKPKVFRFQSNVARC